MVSSEILTETTYAKYGFICQGRYTSYHDQSILRNGLDVAFGVRVGLAARNVIHFCVATNPRPLKHRGLYCYLDLKLAIGELNLRVQRSADQDDLHSRCHFLLDQEQFSRVRRARPRFHLLWSSMSCVVAPLCCHCLRLQTSL